VRMQQKHCIKDLMKAPNKTCYSSILLLFIITGTQPTDWFLLNERIALVYPYLMQDASQYEGILQASLLQICFLTALAG
jgi:hypothetical protein